MLSRLPKKSSITKFALPFLVLLLAAGAVFAQRRGGGRFRFSREDITTARQLDTDGRTPEWKNDPEFEKDVFTFARIRYSHLGRGGRGGWTTDMPDSDLNLSYRLQQMTAMKVDPDGRVVSISDKELFKYPWIYIVEPGSLGFEEDEIPVLRRYLLNGGFLMADDFWGEVEWSNFEDEMKRVFPDREFVELSLDHPIYNCVFPVNAKLQIPSIHTYGWWEGITWERTDAREVHHRAIFDDKGRIMVIAFHNTDNGDGWEREGEDPRYFRMYAEKTAYPIAINVIFYAMTH